MIRYFRNRLSDQYFRGVCFEVAKALYFDRYKDAVRAVDRTIIVERHEDIEAHYDEVVISLRCIGGDPYARRVDKSMLKPDVG